MSSAVTVAPALSVYETVVFGMATPSSVGGFTRASVSVSAGSFPPITPTAARTVAPAEITHVYAAGGANVASHVQNTSGPTPEPVATVAPDGSDTVIVHGSDEVSRALKRTKPPTAPETTGEYSFGRPVLATRDLIAGSRRYSAFPGHSVRYVSRWPEMSLSLTLVPARNFEFPPVL